MCDADQSSMQHKLKDHIKQLNIQRSFPILMCLALRTSHTSVLTTDFRSFRETPKCSSSFWRNCLSATSPQLQARKGKLNHMRLETHGVTQTCRQVHYVWAKKRYVPEYLSWNVAFEALIISSFDLCTDARPNESKKTTFLMTMERVMSTLANCVLLGR